MKTLISSPALRACLHALSAAVLTLSLTSCLTLESVNCSPELSCRGGMTCAAADDVCISAVGPACGNKIPELGEACDDGNLQDGDGCSADCKSNEACGNGIRDETVGEVCDTNSPENGSLCSQDCMSLLGCGNGQVGPGEQCDDSNGNNEDDCLNTCEVAKCGDGFTDKEGPITEECDYRNNEPNCNLNCTLLRCGDNIVNKAAGEECDPPGPQKGFLCTAQCKIDTCGDGVVDSALGEVCDDNNNVTETSCPYGNPTCRLCSADCKVESDLTGAYCGDGRRNGAEVCDDGELSCGTCNASCSLEHLGTAFGTITVNSAIDIKDGDTFALNDGSHLPVSFEFTTDGTTNQGNVRVDLRFNHPEDLTPENVAIRIRNAITNEVDDHRLDFFVSVTSKTVRITHKRTGAVGNQRITLTGSALSISGMSGGSGYDCPEGSNCTKDSDCASRSCQSDRTCW